MQTQVPQESHTSLYGLTIWDMNWKSGHTYTWKRLHVDGVESSPQQIWPWPTTMTLAAFDLDLSDPSLDSCDIDLGRPFLILGWKLEFLHLTLTFDLDFQTRPRYDGPPQILGP